MSLSTQQLEDRQKGIGGSDLAAVLGVCPWRQPIDVFYEKRPDLAGEAGYAGRDLSGVEAIFWGNMLEEPIARGYCLATGRRVRRSNVTARHPTAPWLVGNIDRRVVGERRGLEIKNVSARMADRWGPSGSAEVAQYYITQVMQYLLVMDFSLWDVAALVGGNELRVYTVERDPEWDDLILDSTADFWRRVEAGDPPPIDAGAENALEVLRRVYPGTDGSAVYLDDETSAWAARYSEAGLVASEAEKDKRKAKAHLLAAMGNAAFGLLPDGAGFTRRVVARSGYEVKPTEYVDFRFSKNPMR